MKRQGKQQGYGRAAAFGVFLMAFSGLAAAQTGAVGGEGGLCPRPSRSLSSR